MKAALYDDDDANDNDDGDDNDDNDDELDKTLKYNTFCRKTLKYDR